MKDSLFFLLFLLLCASSFSHRTPPTESASQPSLAIIKASRQHQIIMNKMCVFDSVRYSGTPVERLCNEVTLAEL